jgi:hypothetical protein
MKAGAVSLRHYLDEHPDVFIWSGGTLGTAGCLSFAGQLLSQLGAPYNPREHDLRRSRPSRHGTSVLAG